ncbi:MAG: S8 family serine peptidase [Myxococcota bacterium]
MAKVIVSHRLAGRRTTKAASHVQRKVKYLHNLSTVSEQTARKAPEADEVTRICDRNVATIDEEQLGDKRSLFADDDDLIVEEDVELEHPRLGREFLARLLVDEISSPEESDSDMVSFSPETPKKPPKHLEPRKKAGTFHVRITGADGGQVRGEASFTIIRDQKPKTLVSPIDADGSTAIALQAGDSSVLAIQIKPAGGYFKSVARTPKEGQAVELPPLSMKGPLAWWHEAMGITQLDMTLGAGIRVGVIDMGIGPNAALTHVVSLGSLLSGRLDPHGGADVSGHGSMVTGLIGARPTLTGGYVGAAPAAQVFSIRVYPSEDGSAMLSDIAQAIELLSERYACDLINMSLATPGFSALLEDAIVDAFEGGTLCVVSTGNYKGPVRQPAALDQTVAVGAVGKQGWAPAGTEAEIFSEITDSTLVSPKGLFFGEKFSDRGEQVTCAAPGIGIISTLPSPEAGEIYGDDTGTSLACPLVTGLLAAKLSRDAAYLRMPRGVAKVQRALLQLQSSANKLAYPMTNTGIGIPRLTTTR